MERAWYRLQMQGKGPPRPRAPAPRASAAGGTHRPRRCNRGAFSARLRRRRFLPPVAAANEPKVPRLLCRCHPPPRGWAVCRQRRSARHGQSARRATDRSAQARRARRCPWLQRLALEPLPALAARGPLARWRVAVAAGGGAARARDALGCPRRGVCGTRTGPRGTLFAALTQQGTPGSAASSGPVNAACGTPKTAGRVAPAACWAASHGLEAGGLPHLRQDKV
jgi:hypothetical protein